MQRLLLLIIPGLVGSDRQHQQRQRDSILRLNDSVKAAEFALQFLGGWRDQSVDALASVESVLLKCLSTLDPLDIGHAALRHAIEFKYHLVMIYKELVTGLASPTMLQLEPMLRSWQDLETYCENDLASVVGVLISSKWKRSHIANKLFQLYSHQARIEQATTPSATTKDKDGNATVSIGRVVRARPENALAYQLEAAALAGMEQHLYHMTHNLTITEILFPYQHLSVAR